MFMQKVGQLDPVFQSCLMINIVNVGFGRLKRNLTLQCDFLGCQTAAKEEKDFNLPRRKAVLFLKAGYSARFADDHDERVRTPYIYGLFSTAGSAGTQTRRSRNQ